MDTLKNKAWYKGYGNVGIPRMKSILLGAGLTLSISAVAQEKQATTWVVSGYLETYYSYDVNRPVNNTKPAFLYNHHRNNEVNINLGMVKIGFSNEHLRSNIALGAGTYMNANYTAEPGLLKNIYEANVGVKLSGKANLWLDAGILPSHIGWESAIGKDCPTLTRSIAAENSPYFETGIKLGYSSPNEKWQFSAFLLNGWQRIQRVDGNTTPAFGTQLTYKPTAKITLNSSSFIGNDKPDSIKQLRYFHDLYGNFQLSDRWTLLAGFDIGFEQQAKGSSQMNTWYTPVLIAKYAPDKRLSLSARGEYFSDKHGVIIATGTPGGMQTWGISANVDYRISEHAMWRIEARHLNNTDAIFQKHSDTGTSNLTFTTAFAIGF
jgi:hypothetical protein